MNQNFKSFITDAQDVSMRERSLLIDWCSNKQIQAAQSHFYCISPYWEEHFVKYNCNRFHVQNINAETRMTVSNAPSTSLGIYHERQSVQLCLLHALNNLFQAPVYTKAMLDDVCVKFVAFTYLNYMHFYSLSPDSYSFLNPHRSMLGLGNYDVNVLQAALQLRDYTAVWFDKRK